MNKLISSLTFYLVIFFNVSFSQPKWHWISPYPEGNGLASVSTADGYAYFWGGLKTVVKTSDGGNSFTTYAPYTDIDNIGGSWNDSQRIAFADSLTGIVLDLGGGVFRTANGGKNWLQVLPQSSFFQASGFGNSTIGWVIGGAGFYKTVDAGATWQLIPCTLFENGGTFSKIITLNKDSLWVLKSFHYNKGGGIYFSSNGGITWQGQNTGIISDSLNQMSYTDMKVSGSGIGIAAAKIFKPDLDTSISVILRTTNFGSSWIMQELPGRDHLKNVLTNNSSLWLVLGNMNINNNGTSFSYRSTDYGISWTRKEDILKSRYTYNLVNTAIYISKFQTILIPSGYWIYKSTDFGETFFKLTNDTDVLITDFSIDKNPISSSQLVIATSYFDNQYILSEDGGRSWVRDSIPEEVGNRISESSIAEGNIFILTDYQLLYISMDNGLSWILIQTTPHTKRNLFAYDANNIAFTSYLTNVLNLFYSSDGGENWTHTPLPYSFWINSLQITKPGSVVACGQYYDSTETKGFIYQTKDAGYNWRIVDTDKELLKIYMLYDDTGIAMGKRKVYWTNDNWKSFGVVLSSNDYSQYYSSFAFKDSTNGVIRVSAYQFDITSNSGQHWHSTNINMPYWGSLEKMEYNQYGDLLALGDGGRFLIYTDFSNSFGNNNNNSSGFAVKDFQLFQNHPNPFNPTTNIWYTISSRQIVTLKVYDILGNEVATLVNEEKPVGTYTVKFNIAQNNFLSSGIYFYQLKAGNFTETKKMILLK